MEGQEQKKLGWPKKKKYVYLDKYEEKVQELEQKIAYSNDKNKFFQYIITGISIVALILAIIK
ncbi:MAG: hypothetical protein E6R13_08275 [Spirochaetes bacterium]|nr:MAG: hypothetical protein E6R13_08275 [Spirochaetota bacterium]